MSIPPVQIGGKWVGEGHPTFITGEIGINHNGDLDTAKALIDLAVRYKFDAVKFQKRTVELVYSPEDLARPRSSPFGETNGDLKYGLEFGLEEYEEIDQYCRQQGILWFASAWDPVSVEFLERFNPPCHKVASACLGDRELLDVIRSTGRPVILSTGMSTLEEIDQAVALLEGLPIVILHCTSTYPCAEDEINLSVIETLRERHQRPVGYSGHESSLLPSVMAVSGFEACMVERHITLNRTMWGTDQAASLEPRGMELLSKYVRLWPVVKGDGCKRVYSSELPIKQKLRRVRQ
jgi:N-acetylneuraminate synthase